MYRGTTPTMAFTLPFDASELDKINIAFSQNGNVVFDRGLDGCTIKGNEVIIVLTEEETLLLDDKVHVEVQFRAGIGGQRMASRIFTLDVERILKDGALT